MSLLLIGQLHGNQVLCCFEPSPTTGKWHRMQAQRAVLGQAPTQPPQVGKWIQVLLEPQGQKCPHLSDPGLCLRSRQEGGETSPTGGLGLHWGLSPLEPVSLLVQEPVFHMWLKGSGLFLIRRIQREVRQPPPPTVGSLSAPQITQRMPGLGQQDPA